VPLIDVIQQKAMFLFRFERLSERLLKYETGRKRSAESETVDESCTGKFSE